MSYKQNLIDLDKLVAQSDICDEYRCVWYGDIPIFIVFKEDESFLRGELHEVVESLRNMIPPTIEDFVAVTQSLITPKDSDYRSDLIEDASQLLERYKATRPEPISSDGLSICDLLKE